MISDVRFTRAAREIREDGLLGWVQFVVDRRLRLDGVAVRRTRDGRLTLSFPRRHDRAGREHSLIAPTDARARATIEDAVFAALERELTSP